MNIQAKKKLVIEYYNRIDSKDVDWVISLFSEDANYVRAGIKYVGKKEIASFYYNDRKITGKHALERVIVEGDNIVVNGVFTGMGITGNKKQIGFSDTWIIRNDKIFYRQTYLSVGSEYVKN